MLYARLIAYEFHIRYNMSMDIIDSFEKCFNDKYEKLQSRKITDSVENLFVISSFDNFLNKIHVSSEKVFSYYTIQETFRTKHNHYELWGKDSFLMPYNIMLSVFSNKPHLNNILEKFISFIFSISGTSNYVCICSDSINLNLHETIKYYIKDIIYIPKTCLKWRAPLDDQDLLGEYIKIYKKCDNGFIPIIDCNVFKYNNEEVIDISSNLFTLDCLTNNVNNIYEGQLFFGVDSIILNSYDVKKISKLYPFLCVLFSIVVLIINDVSPSSNRRGSILRSLFNFLFELSINVNFKILEDIDLLKKIIQKYIDNLECYFTMRGNIALDCVFSVVTNEIEKITNKHSNKNLNKFLSKIKGFSVDNLYKEILYAKESLGFNPHLMLNFMKNSGVIDENKYKVLSEKFIYISNVSVVPIQKNDMIDKEFLKNIFLQKG